MISTDKNQIKSKLNEMKTEELSEILRANDRSLYSPDAFDAIEEILKERGISDNTHRQTSQPSPSPDEMGTPSQVIVTDIRMPFSSMVVFMIKWAVAAIPAAIILGGILFILFTLVASLFGLGGLIDSMKH